MPTRVISLEDDRFGTAATVRYIAAAVPEATLTIYPSGGHIWLGYDAEVAAVIEAFVGCARHQIPSRGVPMKHYTTVLAAAGLLLARSVPGLSQGAAESAAVQRADAAMTALQQQLSARLLAEMSTGGPSAAVKVCRDEAQAITAKVAAEQGMEIGRTSHRLRNPANAARPWVAKLLPSYAGRKADEVGPQIVDLGERVGVVKPLPTQPLCLGCHGERSAMAPEVGEMIASAYPQDEATGFTAGEVRGLIWAEVPRESRGAREAPRTE